MNVPERITHQALLDQVFQQMGAQRETTNHIYRGDYREKRGSPRPTKLGTAVKCRVTYRNAERRTETTDLYLQCREPGDRVYEALYVLRGSGIRCSRVQARLEESEVAP